MIWTQIVNAWKKWRETQRDSRIAILKVKALFGASGAITNYTGSTAGVVVADGASTAGIYTITASGAKSITLFGAPTYHDVTYANRSSIVVNSNVQATGVITFTVVVEDNTSGIAIAADATSGDSMECCLLAEY